MMRLTFGYSSKVEKLGNKPSCSLTFNLEDKVNAKLKEIEEWIIGQISLHIKELGFSSHSKLLPLVLEQCFVKLPKTEQTDPSKPPFQNTVEFDLPFKGGQPDFQLTQGDRTVSDYEELVRNTRCFFVIALEGIKIKMESGRPVKG
jgi:hypothetical protein